MVPFSSGWFHFRVGISEICPKSPLFFEDFEFFPWGNAYFVTEECKGAGEYVPWRMNDEIGRLLQRKSQDLFSFSGIRDDGMRCFFSQTFQEDNTPLKNQGNGEQNVNSVKQVFCWCFFNANRT